MSSDFSVTGGSKIYNTTKTSGNQGAQNASDPSGTTKTETYGVLKASTPDQFKSYFEDKIEGFYDVDGLVENGKNLRARLKAEGRTAEITGLILKHNKQVADRRKELQKYVQEDIVEMNKAKQKMEDRYKRLQEKGPSKLRGKKPEDVYKAVIYDLTTNGTLSRRYADWRGEIRDESLSFFMDAYKEYDSWKTSLASAREAISKLSNAGVY